MTDESYLSIACRWIGNIARFTFYAVVMVALFFIDYSMTLCGIVHSDLKEGKL